MRDVITLDGITLHPRSAWNTTQWPVTGPAQIARNITRPAAHYTGAVNLPDGDLGEFEYHVPRYLAAIQRDYMTDPKRMYSIGYLWAIDWLGGGWELRGFDFKAAATYMHNEYTAPFLFLVDGADEATPLACRTARALWREYRRRSGRADFQSRPWGHGEFRQYTGVGTITPCPGVGVLGQLHRGEMDLGPEDEETWIVKPYRRRAIDTRKIGSNGTRLPARSTLTVEIGMGTEAIIKVAALEPTGPGWLSLDGGATTVVDWFDSAGDSGTDYTALTGGKVTITSGPSACHVVVDVQGLG